MVTRQNHRLRPSLQARVNVRAASLQLGCAVRGPVELARFFLRRLKNGRMAGKNQLAVAGFDRHRKAALIGRPTTSMASAVAVALKQ